MSQLPGNLSSESSWSDQSASRWNALVAEVRKLQNLTVGPGLTRTDTGTGITISLAPDIAKKLRPTTTVAVVAKVAEGMSTVTVRTIRYRAVPPGVSRVNCDDGEDPGCTMQWDGEAFQAYPDYGKVAADYDTFFWAPIRPPMRGTAFLRAEYADGMWRVLMPVGGIGVSIGIVRDVGATGDDHFVMVQLVEPDPDQDPWDGKLRFVPDSVAQEVNCWGHFRSRHYYPYVFHGSVITIGAQIVPLLQVDGIWYVFPFARYLAQIKPLASVPTSDCTFARSRTFGGG